MAVKRDRGVGVEALTRGACLQLVEGSVSLPHHLLQVLHALLNLEIILVKLYLILIDFTCRRASFNPGRIIVEASCSG